MDDSPSHGPASASDRAVRHSGPSPRNLPTCLTVGHLQNMETVWLCLILTKNTAIIAAVVVVAVPYFVTTLYTKNLLHTFTVSSPLTLSYTHFTHPAGHRYTFFVLFSLLSQNQEYEMRPHIFLRGVAEDQPVRRRMLDVGESIIHARGALASSTTE